MAEQGFIWTSHSPPLVNILSELYPAMSFCSHNQVLEICLTQLILSHVRLIHGLTFKLHGMVYLLAVQDTHEQMFCEPGKQQEHRAHVHRNAYLLKPTSVLQGCIQAAQML